jgi:hypothetical protein
LRLWQKTSGKTSGIKKVKGQVSDL